MQMKILTAAAALVMALFPARAHSPKIGIHGGPQVDAGSFHVEIFPQGTVLQVYFRDHSDKVVSTQGWKGIAIFTINGKVQRITLSPAATTPSRHVGRRDPCKTQGRRAGHHVERQHRTGQIRLKRSLKYHGCNLDPLPRGLRSPLR